MVDSTVRSGHTSVRMDWLLAVLSVVLVGGFYIDIWAHRHGRVDETFFTPWHALVYAGAASFGVALGLRAIREARRGTPLRIALAEPYRLGFLGSVLFVVSGVGDLGWHSLFGFEVDTEALLSPTHLLLATSGVLMLSGGLRSASARMSWPGERPWRLAGPFVIPLAMAAAIAGAFTQYAHPIVDAWASKAQGSMAAPDAQLYMMASDGSGQRRIAILAGDAREPRISPDRSRLAYTLRTADGKVQIHLSDVDGTNDRSLATDGSAFGPAWSPDGSRIAFALSAGGRLTVYLMSAEGADIRRLTDVPGLAWAPAWSPEGSRIAFVASLNGTSHLFRIDADGRNLIQLTSGGADDWEPAFSPDGGRIAFSSDRGGDRGIYVANADGTDPRPLQTGGDGFMPAWSPDGSRIAFASRRSGDVEVFAVPAAGGAATNLTRNPGADDGLDGPSWSPNGQSIVYPSQGRQSAWLEPFVRQGYGAAGLLVYATVIAGFVTFARRRGRLPFGSFTVLIAGPALLATVLTEESRFIVGAIAAGLLADVVARFWPPGRDRRADAASAFAAPALFFACYFATIALTTGVGWSIHMWLGAIIIAGIVGLFVDEVGRRPLEGQTRAGLSAMGADSAIPGPSVPTDGSPAPPFT